MFISNWKLFGVVLRFIGSLVNLNVLKYVLNVVNLVDFFDIFIWKKFEFILIVKMKLGIVWLNDLVSFCVLGML